MKKHLAIFGKEAVEQILKGKKLVESRFSQKRIAPYNQVSVGDLIYIKPPGEEIKGQFKASKVIYFENLDEGDWKLIKETWGDKISIGTKELDDKYFKAHFDAKYGTLIFIDQVEQFITPPIKIQKSDQRGWVVLG